MTAECAVCYVSDINYLLPSLVSAARLRQFVPAHKADIYIFLIDENDERVRGANRISNLYDIHVLPMNSKIYSEFDKKKYNEIGIPTATLGRLFIDSMLPDSCRRIVYIDGDTWIPRDPSPLIEAIVPDGKFAAVNDILCFRQNDPTMQGRAFRSYAQELGLTGKIDYFNAGVFATSRTTWKVLAPTAYRFFTDNTALCKRHDQSALNAVMGDRRLHLSIKWNFQTQFRYLGIENRMQPYIYHFTEQSKPWMGEGGPWKDLYRAYRDAISPFQDLKLPMKTFKPEDLNAYDRLYWKKALLQKSRLMARLASIYFGIGAYEKSAWL